MWAPADLFTPFLNSVALLMKRAFTFADEHLAYVLIAAALVVVLVVAIGRLVGGRRG